MSASKRNPFLAAAAMTAAAALAFPGHGETPAAPGFYSEAQVERGAKLYEGVCAACHGADLAGAPGAPALSGPEFAFGWGKKTVGELYQYVHDNMPPGEPGGMGEQEYADLVAVILKANKYPAGATELKPDAEAMKAMSLAKP